MASTNIMTGYTYVANYIPEIVFLQVLIAWAKMSSSLGPD